MENEATSETISEKPETLKEILKDPRVILASDIMRIILIVLLIFIIVYMFKEIKAVKILNYDVCRLCENKTGAICTLPFIFG